MNVYLKCESNNRCVYYFQRQEVHDINEASKNFVKEAKEVWGWRTNG